MTGIPPLNPLEHDEYARYRQSDFTEQPRAWLSRRMSANLVVLGILLVAALVFLLTR